MPVSRLGEREDQRREDDHRGDGVDEEVEEFRGAADDDADGDLAGTGLVVAVLARVARLPLRGVCAIAIRAPLTS